MLRGNTLLPIAMAQGANQFLWLNREAKENKAGAPQFCRLISRYGLGI
jgi:hypothetical protein